MPHHNLLSNIIDWLVALPVALLQGARQQASDLRERVTKYNRVEGLHAQDLDEVVYYVGQAVIGADQGPSGQEGES